MDNRNSTFYRLLLRAYPREFRERFGTAMQQTFENERRRAQRGGVTILAVFWCRTGVDWVTNVPREWADFARHEGGAEVRGIIDGIGQDVRFAVRGLARRPGLTALLTLTLGIGIGGVSAIRAVLHGTIYRDLPYDSADRIHLFWKAGSWAPRDLAIAEEGSAALEAVAAYNPVQVVLQGESAPATAEAAIEVSRDFFPVFGRPLQIGRAFTAGERATGAPGVVVISHSLWVDLGSRPDAVGATLQIDGQTAEIVGVTRPGFYFPDPATRIFVPLRVDPTAADRYLNFIGRASVNATEADLAAEASRLAGLMSDDVTQAAVTPRLTPVRTALFGRDREPMLLAAAALALVLVMAAVNVGALLLARTERRSGELALRAAIGASRARLARLLVTEATVLGLLSGGVAVFLGLGAFKLLVGGLPIPAGDAATLVVDRGILLVAPLLGVGVGALVGVMGAFSSSVGEPARGSSLNRAGSRRASLTQSGLVVSQIAMTVLLVAGAGVMVRSVARLSEIETGLAPGDAVVLDLVAGAGDYPTESRSELYEGVREWIESMPRTAAAGVTHKLPLRGRGWTTSVSRPGSPDDPLFVPIRFVGPGYLEALGVPLSSGRLPDRVIDGVDGTTVAWVNQALADRLWPGEDPAGRRSVVAWGLERDVAGVVGDVAEGSLIDPIEPAVYVPIAQVPRFLAFTVVARPNPGSAGGDYAATVVRTLRARVPRVAIGQVAPFAAVERAAQGNTHMLMRLLLLLGTVAMAVGAVGVHGILSQWVSGRLRSWAVSVALGATTTRVLGTVFLRSFALTTTGAALGLTLFVLGGTALESFVYGVDRIDPVSLFATASLIVATGVIGAIASAVRAARTDPAQLLRHE